MCRLCVDAAMRLDHHQEQEDRATCRGEAVVAPRPNLRREEAPEDRLVWRDFQRAVQGQESQVPQEKAGKCPPHV